jgi:hypothetical protein
MYNGYPSSLLPRTIYGSAIDIGAFELASQIGFSEIEKNELVLYPNPTSGKISFEGINDVNSIEIYSNDGRIVNQINGFTSEIFIEKEGLYYIRIVQDNQEVSIGRIWVK